MSKTKRNKSYTWRGLYNNHDSKLKVFFKKVSNKIFRGEERGFIDTLTKSVDKNEGNKPVNKNNLGNHII